MITDLPIKRIYALLYSDKQFSEFLPTRWRQKSTGIDMEQNYVTVTLCIWRSVGSVDVGTVMQQVGLPSSEIANVKGRAPRHAV